MGSKAKSGLSAVRMFHEDIQGAIPPNEYTVGSSADYESNIVDAKGHAEVHAAVANNTSGKLQIIHAWKSTGPWTMAEEQATALDAYSSLQTATIKIAVRKRYVRIRFVPDTDLGADFEMGGYLLPRASGDPATFAGSVAVTVPGVTTLANREDYTVNAATDILAANAVVPGDGTVDVEFVGNKAAIWQIEITRGGKTRLCKFRDGNQVPADSLQAYAVPVKAGDQLNLQQDQATHVVYVLINYRPS